MMKRTIALLLALICAFSLFSAVPAYADEPETPADPTVSSEPTTPEESAEPTASPTPSPSPTPTPERVRALDQIGMSWVELGEERWNRKFRALRANYEQHGDIDVPQDYVTTDGLKLGRFVKNMRFHRDTKYRRCLTPERLKMLDEMGMIWDVDAYRWEQNFAAAEAYYRAHGDLLPTKRYVSPEGAKLGAWLAYQRTKRGRGELEEEKIARLDAIGMVW